MTANGPDKKTLNSLIQFRIRRILMICSNYDAFIMEEDGRIESQIRQEYIDLNLSGPPQFTWANSSAKARELLADHDFDMIICMFNEQDAGIFEFAREIKASGKDLPFVLLMHYSKQIRRRVTSEMDAVDFIFSWHGNADLILAIIKLFEDKRNAQHDILDIGVQAILLVEDSIRYYSTYLPEIYKIILTQSKEFIKETFNEDQQKNLKRFRPKILLETCYQDAVSTYEKYKGNFLGIITDVGMVIHRGDDPKTEKLDAGIDLVKYIRNFEPFMPVLMQSSQGSVAKTAEELGVGFVRKYDTTLFQQLHDYLQEEFGFGDFVFRDERGREYCRAANLQELAAVMDHIPDKVLIANTSRNMFSKWLFSRGLFLLGHRFRAEHHTSATETRIFIKEQVRDYLKSVGRGIIAHYAPETYEDYVTFARMGEGSLGGKARGLAFLNNLVERYNLNSTYEGIRISIPRTVVLSTEFFDTFIEENGLRYVIESDLSDDELLSEFVASRLPEPLVYLLRSYLRTIDEPLAIRSSSKLEDSNYQPFAGVYSTYMIPMAENKEQMLRMLDKAIKSVYASAFYKGARAYVHSTGNLQSEEKMAVVIQSICGSEHGGLFYPMMSGVARSVNFYPLENEKAEDGIVNVVFGLGKRVVEGGKTLRFSPKYPKKILQLSRPAMAMHDTQGMMYALDLRPSAFKISRNEGINFADIPIADALKNYPYPYMVFSTYDPGSDSFQLGTELRGPRVVTYDAILRYDRFPLAKALSDIMDTCRKELMCEVEIEFAADLRDKGRTLTLKLLQVRPISEHADASEIDIDRAETELSEVLVRSDRALGWGSIEGMDRIVYVPEENFDVLKTMEIAREIMRINEKMQQEGRNYLLIGPGRWGSSVQSLGIPVMWNDISEAKMIVEYTIPGFQVEPSQGTHFFQNITSLGVGYLYVDNVTWKGMLNTDLLDSMPALIEGKYVKVIELSEPVKAWIDHKTGRAIAGR
ncbi:MAG: phosphoenolpyruvate synthase [Bacteroidales bacterium]|nr:phosphoenolpyruvate synthase [Bacteroidales bacterium]